MNKAILLDIYTVVWKEWKEIFGRGNNPIIKSLYLLLSVGTLSIYVTMPAKNMAEFSSDSFNFMYFWSIIPYLIMISYGYFGILKERQSKTLLTLIATRIPGYAIVLGKIIIAVVFCWISTILTSMLSIIRANFLERQNVPFFYSGKLLLFGLCISLLFTILIATCAMLASFSAHTALQFQVKFLAFSLLPFLFICFSVDIITYSASYVQQLLGIEKASPTLLSLVCLSCLALIDYSMLIFTIKRFKRSKLIFN